MIYAPQLNVLLYSVKQHIQYIGCYENSKWNNWSVTFPAFTLPIDVIDTLEFTVCIHSTPHTVRPDFDEITAELYVAEFHSLFFNCPDNPDLQEVTIVSTIKTKPVAYPPSWPTPLSISYVIHAPANTLVSPNSRK